MTGSIVSLIILAYSLLRELNWTLDELWKMLDFIIGQMKKINTENVVSSYKWTNRMFGSPKAYNKGFYKNKNDARILDLLHYFGKDWKNWFDDNMYTGFNSRGIISKTKKGVKRGKSNRC